MKRRETESITSVKQLIECPLAWALKYGAHIRPGALNVLPDDDKLIGIVAHAIVERLFEQRKAWRPDEAAIEASRLFDALAVELAAPLLRGGNSVEYQRAKVGVVDAIRQFVIIISNAGLTMRDCEQEVEVPFEPGQKFKGFLDLALEDARGNSIIIDMKWSKQDRVIDAMRSAKGALSNSPPTRGSRDSRAAIRSGPATSMMRQQTLLFTEPVPFSKAHQRRPRLGPSANVARPSAGVRSTHGGSGSGRAHREKAFPADEEDADVDPMPQIDAGCRFCDYRPLCGAPDGGRP